MILDESFYKAEERNGFHITSMMKRVWAVELDITSFVGEVCDRHGLKWFADSGTLLGAVREGGYIAWDDDIDLAMLRADYELFIRYAREELPEGWSLHNTRDDANPNAITLNVFNSDRIRVDREYLDRYHGCPYGIGIDICPLDNIPSDPEEEEVFRLLSTIAYDCFITSQNGVLFDDCDEEVRERVLALEEVSGLTFDRNIPVRPQALDYADKIASMYCDDDTSTDVAVIQFYTPNIRNRKPRTAYASSIMMPFEHIMIPVPTGYDTVLKVAYGDNYMTPVRAANSHNYPNYAGEEKILRRQYEEQGLPFPDIFL